MTKTRLMATIMQDDGASIERRVYTDVDGDLWVKINGEFFKISFLTSNRRTVHLWRD